MDGVAGCPLKKNKDRWEIGQSIDEGKCCGIGMNRQTRQRKLSGCATEGFYGEET